ncbi:hypothetical protein ACFW04_009872 [Cataglyphis niger]
MCAFVRSLRRLGFHLLVLFADFSSLPSRIVVCRVNYSYQRVSFPSSSPPPPPPPPSPLPPLPSPLPPAFPVST